MSADDVVNVLNQLIQVSMDGRKGFAEAAEYATDAGLKSQFILRSSECDQAARDLQLAVQKFGREPKEAGSIAGAAHRGWIKVRAAVQDNNVAVLEEVERGEDHAKSVYAHALNTRLPPEVKTLVERQYHGVLSNHDNVVRLRNRYRPGV